VFEGNGDALRCCHCATRETSLAHAMAIILTLLKGRCKLFRNIALCGALAPKLSSCLPADSKDAQKWCLQVLKAPVLSLCIHDYALPE
jgi:hypothetical protein